jgi:hypothetical protein
MFTEFVEEVPSLFFIRCVPLFNERKPVGAAEFGHQDRPFPLMLRTVLITGARDACGKLGVDLDAVIGRKGEAVEHSVAALVEP